MVNTLITRISNLSQYDKDKRTIIWKDPTESRWVNTYGKLVLGDNVIFINNNNKIFIGQVGEISNGKSVTATNIQELLLKNDQFLQLDAIYPEVISRVKANFQPFLHTKEINVKRLIEDIDATRFINYYIFNSMQDFRELGLSLGENDRVAVLADGVFQNIHLVKGNDLKISPQNNLFNVRGKSLKQLLKITENYKGKDSNSNNVKRIKDIITTLKNEKYYKFKTFFSYHDTLYNARIYGINTEATISKVENYDVEIETISSLNQILYGPPGTGKTYRTINQAISIINPNFDLTADRSAIKKEYDRLVELGQIVFTTFHQSMSYEDFIEGIKPDTTEMGDVIYYVKDGLFKQLCDDAQNIDIVKDSKNGDSILEPTNFDDKFFYKLSLGNSNDKNDKEIYEYCIENDCIALGYGGTIDYKNKNTKEIYDAWQALHPDDNTTPSYVNYFVNIIHNGDYVIISNGNKKIRAMAKVVGDYYLDLESPIRYKHFRKVEWIFHDRELPVSEIYELNLSQSTLYQLKKAKLKKAFFTEKKDRHTENNSNNYVLIIDEINRGNVSAIFGELITLIEEDKRIGQLNEIKVRLPYSKVDFGIPSNVHIIGTMNTADRSVEALDTALRRRFNFKELMPDTKVVLEKGFVDYERAAVMKKLNDRIELLLDRNHTLGHAYFIKADFKSSFENQIIPLLQEYFYNDCGKIGLILGKSFVREKTIDGSVLTNSLLADFPTRNEAYVTKTYELIPFEELDFVAAIESLLSS